MMKSDALRLSSAERRFATKLGEVVSSMPEEEGDFISQTLPAYASKISTLRPADYGL
jgi:hypothetical protein